MVVIIANGGSLTLAGARRRVGQEIELLAATSAAGLTAIGVVYVTKGRMLSVYLLEGVAELTRIGDWLAASRPNIQIIT